MDDFNEGDMMLEIAEYHTMHMTLTELRGYVFDRMREDLSRQSPESIRQMYRDMTGDTDINAHEGD